MKGFSDSHLLSHLHALFTLRDFRNPSPLLKPSQFVVLCIQACNCGELGSFEAKGNACSRVSGLFYR